MYEWNVFFEEAGSNEPRTFLGTVFADTTFDAYIIGCYTFKKKVHDLVIKRKEK